MDDKYLNKYRISSAWMPQWNYGSHGLYYITICTKERLHYFGKIKHCAETQNFASLHRTEIAEIAFKNWLDITNHFAFIELDEFVIMPNHIHGILFINRPNKETWDVNRFGVQSQNLASVLRGYKASVKAYATINNIEFNWQSRYYDRVIRTEKEYSNIREYIFNNPEQWLLNGDNTDNLYNL